MIRYTVALAALCAAGPTLANDSMAGFGVGGLELRQTDAVRLVSEALYISVDEIRVDYVFRNETDAEVTGIVAFPLPPVGGGDWLADSALPQPGRLDYVGFTTHVDGVPVQMTPEHRVTLNGEDRTEDFTAIGVHAVAVHGWDTFDQAQRSWTPAQRAALHDQGFTNDEGYPLWALQSTYWREQSFAPHTDVAVSHRYHPVAGGSVDSWFPGVAIPENPEPEQGEMWARVAANLTEMRARYCVTPEDEARMRAQLAGETGLVGFSTFLSSEVDYILTTGANWRGPIGRFRLVIEAPGRHDFVFACLPEGAVRDSQSRLVFETENFVPERDLAVYVSRAAGEAIPRDDR